MSEGTVELRDAIRRNKMTGFQWNVILICIFLTIVDGYEILITAFTLPALTEHFDLSRGQQGLIASIGTLGMGIGAAVLAPIGDKFGRRTHISFSLILIVIGMVLSGLSPSYELFLVFRFFAGLFLGGIVPSINVLVAEYASDKRRGTAMGIYGIGLPLGAAVGGFLSIWLIGNFTWRGPYFFSAGVTAILLLWVLVALPESVGYLVEKRPKNALARYNKIGAKLGVAPAAELPPQAVVERKPSVGRDMWTGIMLRRTLLLWLSYGLLISAFYFSNTLTAQLVRESTGDPTIGILAQSLMAVGGVMGALTFAALSARMHPRLVTAVLMAFGMISFILFAQFFTIASLVLFLAVLVGIASTGGVGAYYAISPPIYPTVIRATAIGLMMGFGRVIAFLAPNIAAFLLAQGLTPANVYIVYGIFLGGASLSAFLLHRTYRGENRFDAMELEGHTIELSPMDEAPQGPARSGQGQQP